MVSDFGNKVECILLGGVDEMVTNVSILGDGQNYIMVHSHEKMRTCESSWWNPKRKGQNLEPAPDSGKKKS